MSVPQGLGRKQKRAPKCPFLDLFCSIQMKQLLHDLIHVAFPFGNVCNGQDGVYAVVSAGIDGFNIKSLKLKDAQDVAVLYDALGKANAMVPHVIRFFVEWKAVERLQIHGVRFREVR